MVTDNRIVIRTQDKAYSPSRLKRAKDWLAAVLAGMVTILGIGFGKVKFIVNLGVSAPS